MEQHRPKIAVYQDYRHNNGMLYKQLARHYGSQNIGFIDADDIISGALHNNIKLFIMPGGADLFYCEKLNGAGNQAIKDYIKGGGNYLGICAGAYYAAKALYWDKDGKTPITGARELALIDCEAHGPVFEWIENGDINACYDHAATLEWQDGTKISTLYAGGPVFKKISGEAEVLAHYIMPDNTKAAAILTANYGTGRVILSSPHIEADAELYGRQLYKHLNKSHAFQSLTFKNLQNHSISGNSSPSLLWALITGMLNV